jgi:hypothetical protein
MKKLGDYNLRLFHHYEARIEAAENKVQALKSGLQLTETCLRYALTERDPSVKQWFLWHIVHALTMSVSEIEADFGTEPAPTHPFWIECTELVSAPKQPKPFLLREEEHPLKAGKSIFRVYTPGSA